MGHHRVSGDHHLKDLLKVDPRGIRGRFQGFVDTLCRKLLQLGKTAPPGEVHPGEDILAARDLAVVVGRRSKDLAVNEAPDIDHDRGGPEVDGCPVEPVCGVAFVHVEQAVPPWHQGDRAGHVPPAPAEHLREVAEDLERRVDPVRGRAPTVLDPLEQAGEVRGGVVQGRGREIGLVLPDRGVEWNLLRARDLYKDLLFLYERPCRNLHPEVAADGCPAGKACTAGDLVV